MDKADLRAATLVAFDATAELCRDGSADPILAECFSNIRYGSEQAFSECESNANLLAAAPDLLEALEAIMVAEFGRGLKLPSEMEGTYWGKARDVIAKARGKQ